MREKIEDAIGETIYGEGDPGFMCRNWGKTTDVLEGSSCERGEEPHATGDSSTAPEKEQTRLRIKLFASFQGSVMYFDVCT